MIGRCCRCHTLSLYLQALTDVDTARECLEKNPDERTEDDIEILLEFLQNLPVSTVCQVYNKHVTCIWVGDIVTRCIQAFANMTMAIRRALCAVMVYAVVEKAGTVVMNNGEELDSWSVILNGSVKVSYDDGNSNVLNMGDRYVRPCPSVASTLPSSTPRSSASCGSETR